MDPSATGPAPSFGYHPDPEHLSIALDRGEFVRALVLDGPVRALASYVKECRVLGQPGAELPEGLYWFQGLDGGALILQVALGGPPGDATVAPLDQLSDDHPLMAAFAWAEKFWLDGHAVPTPRFELHEAAVTHPGDVDVVIRDRVFRGGRSGQWSYTVIVEGHQQSVIESSLKPRPELDDPRTWVRREPTPARRFGATLTRAKLQSKFANTLFSFRATRTTFRPYQFKPVLKLLQTGKARILIADEVGLGKTIEAGLIWTELEARREADRVLIVCPAGLVGKWKEEMDDRFEFDLVELDTSTLRTFLEKHRQNRLPRRQAYICSIERLRSWDGMEELDDLPPEFDLVIVDEAHSMRNQDTKSYALGTRLTDWADNLVFLTATPINLRQEDLVNLLELLAPGDYGDIRDLELRLEPNRIINAVAARLVDKGVSGRELAATLDQLKATALGAPLMQRPDFELLKEVLAKDNLAPRDIVEAKRYLADLNTLSTVITRTKKVEVDDRKSKRTLDRHEVRWTQVEAEFYDEYLRWCRDRAKAMGRPLHFAMQMPLRLASACLPMARRAVLEPKAFGDITDADSDAPVVRLEPHAGLIAAAKRLPEHVDTKFDDLFEVLRTLYQQGRRALVFTHSRPTLAYLKQRLEADFRVEVMHGGVNREQRRRIMGEFRAGAHDFVLANRVASEGLDFEFCSAVVNYDLPWNPMEIEQRIGRIDRIGQVEEAMLVVNFVNEVTIDERILSRLLDRIGIFESSIGALEPIIAANAPRALEIGFNFSLTPEQREQKMHEVETAIEEQRAGLQDVSDASSALLVSNDVDVAGLEDDLMRTGRYIGQLELAHQFNHRAATFTGVGDTDIAAFDAQMPDDHVLPRYWVRDQVVKDRLARRTWGTEHALLGFRRVARNTDERTVIASFLPYGAASYGWILSAGPAARDLVLLCAQYNSFVFDFILRQFLSQPSIPQGTFEQLPILTFQDLSRLGDGAAVEGWIITRVASLVGDSVELAEFVDELGVIPQGLGEVDRIRAELDAAMFVLYGVERDDVDYIMETFPIVKRKDIAEHGEYRTKKMILEAYDALVDADRTGVPYTSPLDDPSMTSKAGAR